MTTHKKTPYERLIEVIGPLSAEDQQFILGFLLRNDRKARKAAVEAQISQREYEKARRRAEQSLREVAPVQAALERAKKRLQGLERDRSHLSAIRKLLLRYGPGTLNPKLEGQVSDSLELLSQILKGSDVQETGETHPAAVPA